MKRYANKYVIKFKKGKEILKVTQNRFRLLCEIKEVTFLIKL
jgi:hypothetical protein